VAKLAAEKAKVKANKRKQQAKDDGGNEVGSAPASKTKRVAFAV